MKKSPFFDLLNRCQDTDFEQFLNDFVEDRDYIDWNDYVLPMNYGDAQAEYHAIRNSCAIFDVSPLRKYRIQGSGSGEFLDYLLTRKVSNSNPMSGIYVVFCNEDGTLKDDAILHKYANDDFLLLPSDMDHSSHFEALCIGRSIGDVSITDCTQDMISVAVQGPLSATVLDSMGFEGIEHLEPMALEDYAFSDGKLRIARMGFTADLGYECWMSPGQAGDFEQRIRRAREKLELTIPGYGLTALQACRLEGGFIVAGWDCASEADPTPGLERSPFELGLGWLVDMEGGDFFGWDALQRQQQSGPRFTLRSFEIENQQIPDDGAELYADIDGQEREVGCITSSAWSWDLGRMIGNASVNSKYAQLESARTKLDGKNVPVRLSQGPLRRFSRNRQVPAPLQRP